MWFIDHERALFADSEEPAGVLSNLNAPAPLEFFRRDQPSRHLVVEAVGLIRTTAPSVVESILRQAVRRRIVTDEQRNALATYLQHRARRLDLLVGASAGWDTAKQPRLEGGDE